MYTSFPNCRQLGHSSPPNSHTYHHLPADHRVLRCRDGATACPKPKCCQKWSRCRVNQISFQYKVWWWQKWLVLDYSQDVWESIKYLMTIIKRWWHVPITQYSSNPAHEMIHNKTCDTIPIHPSPPWGADDTYPSHNTHPPKSTMRYWWHVPITQYSSTRVHHEVLMTCTPSHNTHPPESTMRCWWHVPHHTIPIHPSPPWGADDMNPSHNTHPLLPITWCCTQILTNSPTGCDDDMHRIMIIISPCITRRLTSLCTHKKMYCKISENNARDLYFQ